MKRIYKIGLVGFALMLVSLHACSLSNRAIDGQVLDETTGKPLADAIVVVVWIGDYTKIFGESSSSCYHVETARTDANGKYHVAAWSEPWSSSDLLVSTRGPRFEAYKAGYTRPDKFNDKPEIVHVKPFTGTKDEYFYYLDALIGSNSCSYRSESTKNLSRLYNAVYEETKSIADTQNQKEKVERMRRFIDELLINETKPTKYDENGKLINVDPKDSYKKEDLPK